MSSHNRERHLAKAFFFPDFLETAREFAFKLASNTTKSKETPPDWVVSCVYFAWFPIHCFRASYHLGKIRAEWGLAPNEPNTRLHPDRVQELVATDIRNGVDLAMRNINMVQEDLVREPLIIYGPLFWKVPGIPETQIRVVKDEKGILHFSCYQVAYIFLSDTRLASYSANLNILNNTFTSDKTVEYMYTDIVAVTTEERHVEYELPSGQVMRAARFFRLAVPSDSIEVAVTSPEVYDLFKGTYVQDEYSQTLNVIREMVRSVKQQ